MKQSQYEITYFVDQKLSEEDRNALNATIDEQVSSAAGSVIASAPTLRRKLAYPIKKQIMAFMRVMNIELDPAKIAEIQDFLKRSSSVLRFTILATPQRDRVQQELMDRYSKRRKDKQESAKEEKKEEAPKKKSPRVKKAKKEVTMTDVEKGIEEALTEEVA